MKKIALIIFALLAFSNYSLSAMDAKKESASMESVGTFSGALKVLTAFDQFMDNQMSKELGAISNASTVVARGINAAQKEVIIVPFGQDFIKELTETCDQPYTREQIQKIMKSETSAVYALGFAQAIRLIAKVQEQREASDDK